MLGIAAWTRRLSSRRRADYFLDFFFAGAGFFFAAGFFLALAFAFGLAETSSFLVVTLPRKIFSQPEANFFVEPEWRIVMGAELSVVSCQWPVGSTRVGSLLATYN